jgi:cytochrome P450
MRIIDEIKELGARLGHEKDRVTERVSDLVTHLAQSEANETFAIMRRLDPIVSAGPMTTIVALAEDVEEVLGDPARFTTQAYAAKLEAITGPFMVGLDDAARHDHDRAAMERAVTPDDLLPLASATYASARRAVAEPRYAPAVDVVAQLADPTLDRVVADLLGTPGPDTATQLGWARSIFHEVFFNVGNLPSIRDRALADAALWRVHLDALIDARKARLEAGEDVPDDVLTRLLRCEDEGGPCLDDTAIRHNLLGTMMAWLPATSSTFARIVEELLHREEELAGAQAAARADDRELLAAYCWEAARFRPQNVALLRHVAVDTTIAAGTDRETQVAAGSTVIASTLSAMHDPAAVDEPEEFRLDRPASHPLLFGHGLHACFGEPIARAQIPALAAALLEGPRIRRARGDKGRLHFTGPFPSSLTVRLGD